MATTPKFETKHGEVWKTAMGHKVRIISGRSHSLIEAEYVDGPVNGYRGINFDASSGTSSAGDALVEREE